MRWVVIGLFVVGVVFEFLAWLGYRRDAREGQSADVAAGNDIPIIIGLCFWGVDVLIVVIWGLIRLMFE
jgi:hypothetical protein